MDSQSEDAELGAMTVKEFCRKYGIGTTKFYEEIKAGRLRAVKCGARTLVLNRDSSGWEHTLPAVPPSINHRLIRRRLRHGARSSADRSTEAASLLS